MARKDPAGVLHTGRALQCGLEQIANQAGRSDRQREGHEDLRPEAREEYLRSDEPYGGGGGEKAGNRPFPRLTRADLRGELATTDERTDQVRGDVGGPRWNQSQVEPRVEIESQPRPDPRIGRYQLAVPLKIRGQVE